MCLLGYCSRELYSLADNSLRKYRQCVRNVAHFWAAVKRRMASSVRCTLFCSQLKISYVQAKGAGTRVLRTGVFLAQDEPSRGAHLTSQKQSGSAMEIHPGRLCSLTWAHCRVRQWAWEALIAFFLPFPSGLMEELICVLLMFHLDQACLKGEGGSSLMTLQPKQPNPWE